LRTLPKGLEPVLKKIQPTAWWAAKTEAIDWDSDFLWLDDNLSEETDLELAAHGKRTSFVLIDLVNSPNQLDEVRQILASRVAQNKL